MVYFIKSSDVSSANTIKQVAGAMVNMELNKHVFDKNGNMNKKTVNQQFNQYVYNSVEYDATMSFGIILVYVDEDTSVSNWDYAPVSNRNYASYLIDYFNKHAEMLKPMEEDRQINVEYCGYNTTHHTMLSHSHRHKGTSHSTSHRRCIRYGDNDMSTPVASYASYMWRVLVVNKESPSRQLHIAEMSKSLSKSYLLMSLTTIIVDAADVFDVKTGLKQINFPSLTQYRAFKEKRILDECISLKNTSGIDVTLLKCYIDEFSLNPFTEYVKCSYKSFDSFKLKRRNPAKPWHLDIREEFKYEHQEEMEKKSEEMGKKPFPRYVCFITQMPLYGRFYVFKVCDANGNNMQHIAVAPIMTIIEIFNKSFNKYFTSMSKYKTTDMYISDCDKTELDAIATVPDTKMTPIKKHILSCIVRYGCLESDNRIVYVPDVKNNHMYLGLPSSYDADIISHADTNTTIFHVV